MLSPEDTINKLYQMIDNLSGMIAHERNLREEAELKAVKSTDALTDVSYYLSQDIPPSRKLAAIESAVTRYYREIGFHVEKEDA